MTANDVYRGLLSTVALSGKTISPRGLATKEILGYQTCVDMRHPIVAIPSRKINYPFMAAEAYWILTGQQSLLPLIDYCPKMAEYSDDGLTLSGAYGPRFLSQARYVAETLVADSSSRQAVMTTWERNPRKSKDIPCTVSLQWLLRDNRLHCIAHMRSSDAWLGWPYDVFSFTMMSCYIKLLIKQLEPVHDWELGNLRLMAGSQHLYASNETRAKEVYDSPYEDDQDTLPITLHGMNTPGDLLSILGVARTCLNERVISALEPLCHSK